MRKLLLNTGIAFIVIVLSACIKQNRSDSETNKPDLNLTKNNMKNLISIIEIPTSDFPRAVTFYQKIMEINIEVIDMDSLKIGSFPSSGEGAVLQLIAGPGYEPSVDGTIVYLNAGNDLQIVAEKIELLGGKILVPKTAIAPDMGFYALFIDTEGNKLGLHSVN